MIDVMTTFQLLNLSNVYSMSLQLCGFVQSSNTNVRLLCYIVVTRMTSLSELSPLPFTVAGKLFYSNSLRLTDLLN